MTSPSSRFLRGFTLLASTLGTASAVNIAIDYRYDTNNFFTLGGPNPDAASARAALESAAARWSRVLDAGNLNAATINDTNDGRIGFSHPGTGASFQVSGAAGVGSDAIAGAGAGAADEYRPITFTADTWILYAGGRSLSVSGQGGTGTGTNFTSTFTDPNSHLNRGFGGFNAAFGSGNLPTWGGSITFNNAASAFRYDGDFYSIALHEIGHALGLNISGFGNFDQYVSGSDYFGPQAIAAFNADNGTSASSLSLVSSTNPHWADNGNPLDPPADAAQSFIFDLGGPDYTGTVGPGVLQDLLMEPFQNFVTGGSNPIQRIELTNVDIGGAEDLGWAIIPEPGTSVLVLLSAAGFLRRKR
jgi:hypothetical protein